MLHLSLSGNFTSALCSLLFLVNLRRNPWVSTLRSFFLHCVSCVPLGKKNNCQSCCHYIKKKKSFTANITFFASVPVYIAYRHLPNQQLVTSFPVMSWAPTSALPSALAHTLWYYFCRKRFASFYFTTSLTNRTESERFRPQHIEWSLFWNFMDFITCLRKPCPWTHKTSKAE